MTLEHGVSGEAVKTRTNPAIVSARIVSEMLGRQQESHMTKQVALLLQRGRSTLPVCQ